ncbi:hypothetical protein GCM10022394_25280 [Zobellella aerophila]|uniref:Uncharacterized protein n=1 Tax=Zobellella aerophila TaxID=870480 RepID=A0ABP6W0I3_9GAMM
MGKTTRINPEVAGADIGDFLPVFPCPEKRDPIIFAAFTKHVSLRVVSGIGSDSDTA